jgi:hypothetical protein
LSMYVIPAKAGIYNKEPADVQYLSLRVIIASKYILASDPICENLCNLWILVLCALASLREENRISVICVIGG